MRCSRAEELMSLSLDGEASPQELIRLEEHLGDCARCFQRWQSLRGVSALLGSSPMAEPAHSLVEAVMWRVEGIEPVPDGKRRSLAANARAVVAVLCAVVVGDILVVGAAYFAGQSGMAVDFVSHLVGMAWKLVSIATLFGDIGWDIISQVAGIAQGSALPLMLCISLALAALWAHIIKNYRGVEVRQ